MNGIVLIGMPGVGKSTIGKLLAERIGYEFTDLDISIKEKFDKSPEEMIDCFGEQRLLDIEKQALYELDLNNRVVAPGGSIVYNEDLMNNLWNRAFRVYLADTFENIEARIGDGAGRGIIGLKTKSLREIFDERKPLYEKYFDIAVKCTGKEKEDIVKIIATYFGR